jgi:hypothetical protein
MILFFLVWWYYFNNSINFPSFYLSSQTSTIWWTLLLAVASSFWPILMITGYWLTYCSAILYTFSGHVAENIIFWLVFWMTAKIPVIYSSKPWSNILSASSKTIILTFAQLREPSYIRSMSLPGVPTTI